MTNKTTPDEDWLGKILDEVYENGYNWGDGFHPLLSANEVQAKAEAAINAKITELLIAELDNIAVKLIKAVGGANYITNIPIERIIELQASQPINLNESEK
jgi:hypothetical protein